MALVGESITFFKTKRLYHGFEGYVFFIAVMWVFTKPLVFFKVRVFKMCTSLMKNECVLIT